MEALCRHAYILVNLFFLAMSNFQVAKAQKNLERGLIYFISVGNGVMTCGHISDQHVIMRKCVLLP